MNFVGAINWSYSYHDFFLKEALFRIEQICVIKCVKSLSLQANKFKN